MLNHFGITKEEIDAELESDLSEEELEIEEEEPAEKEEIKELVFREADSKPVHKRSALVASQTWGSGQSRPLNQDRVPLMPIESTPPTDTRMALIGLSNKK
jgi:hypothetical protein